MQIIVSHYDFGLLARPALPQGVIDLSAGKYSLTRVAVRLATSS
jgi:hypothetical protein